MNKLILNFFGEEVTVERPKTLQNLKQEIANKFFFSPSDASELLVSYIKDLKRTFIQTEQDFVYFIKKQIYKVDLDISPDSQLYKKSVLKIQEENEKDKKELEELIKKKEELKKQKKDLNEERTKKNKELWNKIKELNRKRRKLIKETKKEKEKISGEINSTDKKILELQKKLGVPITVEEKIPQDGKNNQKSKAKSEKKMKKTTKKKVVKKKVTKKVVKKTDGKKPNETKDIFTKVNETIKQMSENLAKLVTEQLSKKTKEVEVEKKKIEESKIQLKEDEMKGFINFTSVTHSISKEINKWTLFVTQHTNELTNALSIKYNNCINAINSLKKNENDNEKLKATVQKKSESIQFKEQNKDLNLHPFIKIYSPEMAL